MSSRPAVPLGSSRRQVIKGAIPFAAAAMLAAHDRASAGRGWCRSDPLVLIDGILVDIFCTAPLKALLLVTGPNEIVISVPKGVKTTLILADLGFGRGERVRFEESERLQETDSAIEVEVEVYVPAKEDFEIGVEFAPRLLGILNPDRAEGLANEWVTLATELAMDGLLPILLDEQSKHRTDRRSRKRRKRKRR